jgi:hypothetical protein
VKTKKPSGILSCYSGFSIKTIPQDSDEFYARFDLNDNKDIKMKTSIAAKSLKHKLWIVCWVSLLGLGACSNETQKPDNNNIESSEMTPVQTASEEKDQAPTPNSTENEEGAGGTAYYSSSGSVENDQKADDTVTVNENNPNLDKASADGVQ